VFIGQWVTQDNWGSTPCEASVRTLVLVNGVDL